MRAPKKIWEECISDFYLCRTSVLEFSFQTRCNNYGCNIIALIARVRHYSVLLIPTIHRMEPEGCSAYSLPLHLVLIVAKPKSPIFTVRSSCKKISGHWLRKELKYYSTMTKIICVPHERTLVPEH